MLWNMRIFLQAQKLFKHRKTFVRSSLLVDTKVAALRRLDQCCVHLECSAQTLLSNTKLGSRHELPCKLHQCYVAFRFGTPLKSRAKLTFTRSAERSACHLQRARCTCTAA